MTTKAITYIVALFFISTSCLPDIPEVNTDQTPKPADVFTYRVDKVTFDTEWVNCAISTINISPTAKLDSIVFAAMMRSESDTEHTIVRLYNYTDDEIVVGTTIQSLYRYWKHTVYSGDVERTFPRGEIQIGAQFRSSLENSYAQVIYIQVFVYYTPD